MRENLSISRQQKALMFVEKYGIITYKITGNKLVFYKTYPAYLGSPAYSMRHIVNLDTGIELVEHSKKVVKEGMYNI